MRLAIDFLQFQPDLKVKKEGKQRFIFCVIRKKYLVLQPEELVRQLTIQYLIAHRKYNRNSIHVERGLTVNGLYRRTDIIVYDENIEPYLLVECKRPKVKITQAVFDQIARYNLTLKVKYLLVTNGIDTFCCAMNYEAQAYRFLEAVPMGQ
ncbi:MAG: type I restriction enzyme HsdR N-terminal domain-containing protein [Saprospiraceae bacterium]